jgi:Bacterial membrane protein YfhO
LVVLLVLLSAGIITGYLDIIPHFVRGEKVSLSNSLLHPANIQTWISALLPFSTVKNDAFFNTDPSMRNSYFGLVLLLFFLLACFNKKNNWQMFLLITGLFFALLSAGGIFKTFAYKFIPFTGYVRLNGEFRIFTLLCFIAVAAIELDKFTRQKNYFTGSIKRLYYLIGVVLITCIIVGFYQSINTRISGLFGTENIFQQDTIALTLKTLIDTVSFYDTLWIQGILQLILWWGIKRCLISGNIQLLKKIVVADLVLASLLNIPFTGVGKISVATVQSVINESPGGIPIPVLQPINNIDTFSMEKKSMIGDRSIYNKQIGVKSEVAYPIMLKNMKAYFDNDEKHPGSNFLHYPFVFFKEPTVNSHITIEEFSPNKIKLLVDADSSAQIILQQNYYPHWSFQIDGNKQKVEQAGINFMGAPVIKGRHHIEFIFDPWVVKWGMLLSTFLLVIYCILLILTYSKQSFLSQAKKGVK